MPADDDALIQQALQSSRFSRRLVDGNPALLHALHSRLHHPWDAGEMQAVLDSFAIEDEAGLKKALRSLRQQVMLRLIVRDLGGLADLDEVVSTATMLAEICIRFALPQLDQWLAQQHGTPMGEDSGSAQDLIVVGMGKLGGEELNVSSDIDLIFAYAEDSETGGNHPISNHEYFTRLGKKLISALSEVTADGFVFRVDMRLRPYGESGPLLSSFAMLENYYQTQGREWERYAWIKGRVIGGSRGEELLQLLHPFVFRKYLDFGAFASMRELHAQIRREVARRELSDNIKLGPGGIREIEFVAQVFQLIRGGRDAALQTRPTLKVLPLLQQRKLLPPQAIAELRDAYVFLRNLEHRLQYLEDAQTQTLPENEADRKIIAAAMGFAAYGDFAQALDAHRSRVTRYFEQVFAAPQSAAGEHPLTPLWQETIGEKEALATLAQLGFAQAQEVWRHLMQVRHGSRYRSLPETSRARMDMLLPALIEVSAKCPDPDGTLKRVLQLLESISSRESYLALLLEYPQTLSQVAKLCSASQWAAEYLAQHPILLDELLDARTLHSEPDRLQLQAELQRLLADARGDVEQLMNRLRHFKHAQTFRLLAQDLAGLLTLERLSDHLSDLADIILDTVLQLCWAMTPNKHRASPGFAVIGYGKLGGRELGYASDLDLIFLYADNAPEAAEIYARLAQRINTWLVSLTPAGMLYDTDLRLRPDGASGLLVSSIEAFEQYQKLHAWVWEHQALTRARWVAGDAAVSKEFERIRCEVLQQERDPEKLRAEIIAMRQKMLEAHPNPDPLFDIKHDRGGIIDVEFMVQYLVLAHSHRHPELTRNIGNLALLQLAGELGLIPADLAEQVRESYREFRRLQHGLRLKGERYARTEPEQAAPGIKPVLQLWQMLFE